MKNKWCFLIIQEYFVSLMSFYNIHALQKKYDLLVFPNLMSICYVTK